MKDFFADLHISFTKRKFVFVPAFVFLILTSVWLVLKIDFREDADDIIPKDTRIDTISEAFKSSGMADKIIVTFSLRDKEEVNTELLISVAERFTELIKKDSVLIQKTEFRVDESQFLDVYDFIYQNLPLYLDENDYEKIRELLTDKSVKNSIDAGYRSLISPAGMFTSAYFFRDPLNIVPIALQKLQDFNIDDNFTVHNSCIFTKDKKHLLVFIDPVFPAGNTRENAVLVKGIQNAVENVSENYRDVYVEFYGGTVVALENASQIKRDIIVTVTVAFLFLALVFWLFFRRIRIILYLFIPVITGAALALATLSLIAGEVSLISLGVGGILLCISIDYSLHLITHNRKYNNIRTTLQKVSGPVMISSITTASAILCIYVLNAEALKQLSLFSALGIIFSAIAALTILPFLIKNIKFKTETKSAQAYEKIINADFHKNNLLIILIIALSLYFPFTLKNLKFNSDIAVLNYQSETVSKAEQNLKEISAEAASGIFVFTKSNTLDSALQKTEENIDFINDKTEAGIIETYNSAADLIFSKSAQIKKIEKWNSFWTDEIKDDLKKKFSAQIAEYGFAENAFDEFFDLTDRDFRPIDPEDFTLIINAFLDNHINFADDSYYVATILRVDSGNKSAVLNEIVKQDDLIVYDNQLFINKLLEILKEDFNKLSTISIIVVFLLLLLFFGRIELAIITFIPIMAGWLWTLGLMSTLGLEFNVFNIIILSFIFGLGLDYSIFLISGLIDNYKYGNKPLTPYKLSVFISAMTTIGGFGVLILAKHPALKSIAFVSIIGICSILIISFTLIPLLFNTLIYIKDKRRKDPITLKNTLISVLTFLIFLAGTIIMSVIVLILYLVPVKKKQKQQFISYVISFFSKFIVIINFPIKRYYIDKHKADPSVPSVIIANHQSHLDLVLILMLFPKTIVFTNKWVWNNIFYGFVIRAAGYFPAYKGLDQGFDKLKQKIRDGYSILIFPEGSRSSDGKIKRFHQGAFNVAHKLNIEITPVMIHGAHDCLPRNEFFLREGKISIRFFDKIKPEPVETGHGITYRQQSKNITAFYRQEYEKLKTEAENPSYFAKKLVNQYIYKSPVLEWYAKIKIKLEKNYSFFNERIPRKAKIADIGCGYGFLTYMLRLTSKERQIIGIDYDKGKTEIAGNLAINDDGISFLHSDVSKDEIPDADVYVLNDVLHYMPLEEQIKLINKCLDKIQSRGMLIIRDADADMKKRTFFTKLTEIQSTKIFKFNLAKHKLTYIPGTLIKNLVSERGYIFEVYDNAKFTSNITYIIKKN